MTEQDKIDAAARRKQTRADTSAGYLATLPEGWEYAEVTIRSSEGSERVSIYHDPTEESPHRREVVTTTSGTSPRRVYAETLPEALRAAAAGIKALDGLAAQEKALREARTAAYAALGEPDAQSHVVADE